MSSPGSMDFLDAASAIGARLCRDALWQGGRCNWVGASMEAVDSRWQVVQRSFGPEIYAGTSGIAYFLLRLFRKTGDRVVARTAEGALRHALSAVRDLPPTTRFGFYTGLTGVAFACAEAGKALGDERWTARASELLKGLGEPPGGAVGRRAHGTERAVVTRPRPGPPGRRSLLSAAR